MGGIKIGVMSDLHIEFEPDWSRELSQQVSVAGFVSSVADRWEPVKRRRADPGHPQSGPDLRAAKAAGLDFMILAGDIHHMAEAVQYATSVGTYLDCPVIVVPGNHEYYGTELASELVKGRTRSWAHEQVYLLDRDRSDFSIRGQTVAILGTTLWTDFELLDSDPGTRDRAMAIAQRDLTDFSDIRLGARQFRPSDSLIFHNEARDWLRFEAPHARKTAAMVIVVTHHAPIPDAIPPNHRGSDLSPAFASDMRAEIEAWQPDLWVWGHTHFSMDKQFGRTKLVSAQRGYLTGDEMAAAEVFEPMILETGE